MALSPAAPTAPADAGLVFLIGSDPRRPGELPWPAVAALAAADAVLHDRDVAPGTLALVPRHCLVEPAPGDIARIRKLAREGWRVVWLVAGDPTRSPERRGDAERLEEAGIATHTIAGVLRGTAEPTLGPAAPTAAAFAPQLLATALNGLAG